MITAVQHSSRKLCSSQVGLFLMLRYIADKRGQRKEQKVDTHQRLFKLPLASFVGSSFKCKLQIPCFYVSYVITLKIIKKQNELSLLLKLNLICLSYFYMTSALPSHES